MNILHFFTENFAIAPFVIPAIQTVLALGQSLPKIFGGNKELDQANALGRIKQPPFRDISPEQTALNIAKFRALRTRLPGQNMMEQKIGAATGNLTRYATETAASPVDALATASAGVGNQQSALADLAVQGAQYHDTNEQRLIGEQKDFGQTLEKKWDWEQRQPYLWAKQKESALRKPGAENVQHGWEGVLGAVSGGLTLAENKGLFDSTGGGTQAGNMPKQFMNVPSTLEGLTPEQKMQNFKIKNGRLPYSWELSSL